MEAAASSLIESDPRSFDRFRKIAWGLLCFGIAGLLAVTAWEFSFPDYHFALSFYLFVSWAIISICWALYVLVRLLVAKSLQWFGWRDAVVGIAAVVALGMALFAIPFEIRFLASESAMTTDASRIIANPSTAKSTDRVGRWPATDVETFRGGMRFLVPEIGWLDPVGFAYSVDGKPPPNIGGEDIYHRKSEHWWVWQESW